MKTREHQTTQYHKINITLIDQIKRQMDKPISTSDDKQPTVKNNMKTIYSSKLREFIHLKGAEQLHSPSSGLVSQEPCTPTGYQYHC